MFRFELFSRMKSILIWALAFLFMIVAGMTKMVNLSEAGSTELQELIGVMPRIMRVVYGMEGYDLTNTRGYAALILFFVLVMSAFHGSSLGVGMIGRDIQQKTVDFLFVKPWSRKRVFLVKAVAGIVIILLLQTVIAGSFYSMVKDLQAMDVFGRIVLASLCTHLFFYFLGLFFSIVFRGRDMAQKATLLASVLGYFAVIIGQLYSNETVERITPLGFFPKTLMQDSFYPGIAVTVLISLLVFVFALKGIQKKQFEG